MNINELKQGDILLFSPEKGSFVSWAITFLTNSNVSHAAMFYNKSDQSIVEETPPQVSVNNAEERFKERTIYVKRLKSSLDMTPVINQATTYLNDNEPYDDVGLYMVGALLLYKKFTPDNLHQKIIIKILKKVSSVITQYINEHKFPGKSPMVCSQFVAQCYSEAGSEYELIIENGTLQSKMLPRQTVLHQVLDVVKSRNMESAQTLVMASNEMVVWQQESSEDLCKELQTVLTADPSGVKTTLSDEFVDAVSQFAYVHHQLATSLKTEDMKLLKSTSFIEKLLDDHDMFTFPSDLMDHCSNVEQVGIIEI